VTKTDDPLLAAWAEILRRQPNVPAIFNTRGEVLFRFHEIETLSRDQERIALRNMWPGEVLAVQIGNHAHWPALFLACLRRKIVVLPLERTMSILERASALRTCRAAALLTSPETGIERLEENTPVDWQGRQPVLLKLTSGTTAAPRAVRFRSVQLFADAIQICQTMGIGPADLNFAVIPLSHSYGFSNLVTPLVVLGVPMAISNDRLPRAVLDSLAQTKATILPAMPVFFQAFSEMVDPPPLPKLRLCISAGAPLNPRVTGAFRERFGLPIHSFYGASECGGICYDRTADALREGFVGSPMQGVELERLGTDAAVTQVRVRSSAVGDGYFPETEPSRLGDGSFLPDDLVSIDETGVCIVGRISDIINVAGKKVNPAEIEAHLLSHQHVRQAVVFGRPSLLRNEEVVACVVADNVNEAALLEFCRARLSGWQVPKRIFLLDALPVNERGKVIRRELAEQFST
jgi:long-chain acyl-CoA synthetase